MISLINRRVSRKVAIAHLALGGEGFSTDFRDEIARHVHVSRIVNLYGPTEATIDALERMYNNYPKHLLTPDAMLKLGEAGVIKHIKHIGLSQSKAKHVLETCAMLLEHHNGEVPREREALQALAGVGRKTANVVLNTAFGEATMAVDTHIFRVANRTGLAPGKDVLAVEMKLLRFIEAEFMRDAHHWLILHGRYVCKARKPECPICPVRDLCAFRQKTEPEDFEAYRSS